MANIKVRVDVADIKKGAEGVAGYKKKATVKQRPKVKKLTLKEDTVEFTSNYPGAAIKFKGSPLDKMKRRRILKLPAKGTFVRTEKDGKIRFECGRLVGKVFRPWEEGSGVIPPC